MKISKLITITCFVASIIFNANIFAGDEILLRDFEQIPQDGKIKNVKLVDGVQGKAANFNGYTSEWEESGLNISSKTLFIQAWIAPQQYSFNYDAVVYQANDEWKGFSLGINYQGKITGMIYADGKPQVCYSQEEVPLLKWSHIAMSWREGEGIELFLNGKSVGKLQFAGKAVFDAKNPLIIGHCPIKQLPRYMGNPQNKNVMRFHGLVDKLEITETIPDTAVLRQQIASTGKTGEQVLNFPDLPGKEIKQGQFGAFYMRLKYGDDGWESLWRVDDYPDVVVRFPNTPVKFVFWRGTSYVPAIVSENNIWVTDQCLEIAGLGECYEALSDKQCRYSHVRIIENTPVRCVVHWRYAVSNVGNKIAWEDEHGWGEWADEYWTVYPDGIAVRKQILHSSVCKPDYTPYEFDEILPLNAAGTRNEDNLELEAVTFADMDGNTAAYSWENSPPKNFSKTKYQPIEMINIKAKYKPFFIFEPQRIAAPWT
ncbi:MAG: LamG domain-containing protein, partial [Planctomycetaceae bacterium]|nr:LamG domain-containing protein [Planctomycetaceae bacterium]